MKNELGDAFKEPKKLEAMGAAEELEVGLPHNQGWGADVGAGCFWFLEPEPLEKKTRSRSRLEKKSGAGAA